VNIWGVFSCFVCFYVCFIVVRAEYFCSGYRSVVCLVVCGQCWCELCVGCSVLCYWCGDVMEWCGFVVGDGCFVYCAVVRDLGMAGRSMVRGDWIGLL